MDLLPFEEFDLHLGIVGQAFPPILPQFVLELGQLAPPRGQQITAPRLAEEGQRFVADHAAVHDPDSPGLAKLRFDLSDNGLDGLQVSGVAGERAVGQREAVAGHNQRDDDLLAIAAVIAGIASRTSSFSSASPSKYVLVRS